MTNHIFEIIDKSNKRIKLTKKQWSHIIIEHSDVKEYYIEETIKNPIKVFSLKENKKVFYKYFKHKKDPAKYLKVIVKYLNGSGFVITSYFVRKIK